MDYGYGKGMLSYEGLPRKGIYVAIAVLALYVLLTVFYLKSEETPNVFYHKYLYAVKQGVPYEQLQHYMSRRQNEENEAQITKYSERMGKKREEVILILSEINRKIEHCKQRKMIGRMEEAEQANLQYVLKETCDGAVTDQTEHVRLIKEGGHWKIDAIEVAL